jgi:hypothetical protein
MPAYLHFLSIRWFPNGEVSKVLRLLGHNYPVSFGHMALDILAASDARQTSELSPRRGLGSNWGNAKSLFYFLLDHFTTDAA